MNTTGHLKHLDLVPRSYITFLRSALVFAFVGLTLAIITRPTARPEPSNNTEKFQQYTEYQCRNEGGVLGFALRGDGSYIFECKSGLVEYSQRPEAQPKVPTPSDTEKKREGRAT